MLPVAIRAFSATTALGRGVEAQASALAARRGGLRRNDFGPCIDGEVPLPCWIGRVDGIEDAPLPEAFARWECRNRLEDAVGLQPDGSGGSRFPDDLDRSIVHTPHSLGDFIQHVTGLRGPCITVATACSSSAKVFAQAARLINAGVVDAALVGGVDTLCGSVLFGFNALQLVAPDRCQPFDAARVGLSLGEAGGFAVLERIGDERAAPLRLSGYGESSDAHHMSAPHPQGAGAENAMRDALARAGIGADDVGYLNLHGTATPANDSIEAAAVARMFPAGLHASSTKGWTGHTLGAAGIVESVFALLALQRGVLPGILNSATPDPACGPQIRFDNAHCDGLRYAMNNSFGFGGNNCSLVFGAVREEAAA